MVRKLTDLFEKSVRARWLVLVTGAFAVVSLVFAASLVWTGDDPASASTRPTDTPVETATNTDTPVDTNTPTDTNTPVDTSTPTDTNTPTDTPTDTPTETPTPLQKPLSQSDHALFDATVGGGAEADKVWCSGGSLAEPWELHVSARAITTGVSLTITFGDLGTISFPIPDGTSFSLTHAMGGVPGVDDVVKVSLTANGGDGWVSALARPSSIDPFDEAADGGAAESDNYCLTANPGSANPADGDAGHNSAKAIIGY